MKIKCPNPKCRKIVNAIVDKEKGFIEDGDHVECPKCGDRPNIEITSDLKMYPGG